MKNSVYKNALGLPESVGTISFVNTKNLFNEKSYFSFASTTDAPGRKWAEGTSAEEMTQDMENDGWTCEFKKDGFGKLCASCVHINTQKIIDAANVFLRRVLYRLVSDARAEVARHVQAPVLDVDPYLGEVDAAAVGVAHPLALPVAEARLVVALEVALEAELGRVDVKPVHAVLRPALESRVL